MFEIKEYLKTTDADSAPLDGSRNYKFHLPSGIPVCNFWSVIVYDNETGLIIQTDQQWPSVHSQGKNLSINDDGSMDIWFGPGPLDKETKNWVKTIPGKGWNMILRLYDSQDPGFEKRWRPDEIVRVI